MTENILGLKIGDLVYLGQKFGIVVGGEYSEPSEEQRKKSGKYYIFSDFSEKNEPIQYGVKLKKINGDKVKDTTVISHNIEEQKRLKSEYIKWMEERLKNRN